MNPNSIAQSVGLPESAGVPITHAFSGRAMAVHSVITKIVGITSLENRQFSTPQLICKSPHRAECPMCELAGCQDASVTNLRLRRSVRVAERARWGLADRLGWAALGHGGGALASVKNGA